jgi:hypothetical protein
MAEQPASEQREKSRALLAKLKSKRTFRGSFSLTKLSDEEGKEKVGPSYSQIMEEKISSM